MYKLNIQTPHPYNFPMCKTLAITTFMQSYIYMNHCLTHNNYPGPTRLFATTLKMILTVCIVKKYLTMHDQFRAPKLIDQSLFKFTRKKLYCKNHRCDVLHSNTITFIFRETTYHPNTVRKQPVVFRNRNKKPSRLGLDW